MAKPFIKAVGGKTQILPQVLAAFPRQFNAYYEPFLGGGAVFYGLQEAGRGCGVYYLSDLNSALMLAYKVVAKRPGALLSRLRELAAGHSEVQYYAIREAFNVNLVQSGGMETLHRAVGKVTNVVDPSADLSTGSSDQRAEAEASAWFAVRFAAWFIYLNKTGFNGLYRVNRSGRFNVPMGRKANGSLLSGWMPHTAEAIQEASLILSQSNTSLTTQDWKASLEAASPGDLVYFDPPYAKLKKGSFTDYQKDGFGPGEQAKLALAAADLVSRGVHVVLSNHDTELTRSLYPEPCWEVVSVGERRSVNSSGKGRGKVPALAIIGRPT